MSRENAQGSTLHLTTTLDARALYPEIRTSRGAVRERVKWDASLDYVVENLPILFTNTGQISLRFIFQDNY